MIVLTAIPSVSVSIRAAAGSPPARLTGAVAAAIDGVDRDLAVGFQTVSEQLSIFYIRERLLALLSGFFGALALLLAGLGMYGVAAYAVGRRRTEIGIRLALGADPAAVVRMVLWRVSLLVAAGIVVGSVASLWASRFVGTLLFSIPSRDPVTLAAAGTRTRRRRRSRRVAAGPPGRPDRSGRRPPRRLKGAGLHTKFAIQWRTEYWISIRPRTMVLDRIC